MIGYCLRALGDPRMVYNPNHSVYISITPGLRERFGPNMHPFTLYSRAQVFVNYPDDSGTIVATPRIAEVTIVSELATIALYHPDTGELDFVLFRDMHSPSLKTRDRILMALTVVPDLAVWLELGFEAASDECTEHFKPATL